MSGTLINHLMPFRLFFFFYTFSIIVLFFFRIGECNFEILPSFFPPKSIMLTKVQNLILFLHFLLSRNFIGGFFLTRSRDTPQIFVLFYILVRIPFFLCVCQCVRGHIFNCLSRSFKMMRIWMLI